VSRFPSDGHQKDALAKSAAKIGQKALRIMSIAVSDKTPDQIKADASLPMKEAPMYLHAAAKIATAIVTQDAQEAAPRSLHLTLVSGAESREKWLEEVAKSKAITVESKPVLPPKAG
jgi:hypothetical protein